MEHESFTPKWYSRYREPPVEEMNRTGSSDWVDFVRQSDAIAPMIYRKLRDHVGEPLSQKAILDFGCGVGRVALQLHARWGAPSVCRDVNENAVQYLSSQLPRVDVRVNNFKPPLDITAGALDAAYSVSVWTHLDPDMQEQWLAEMHRMLKSGGIALLTTAGALAVRLRRRRRVPGWTDVHEDQLKQEGSMFRPYNPGNRPGIEGDYGLTAHHPDWLRREWGKVMEVVAIHERVIDGVQDLVILRKP